MGFLECFPPVGDGLMSKSLLMTLLKVFHTDWRQPGFLAWEEVTGDSWSRFDLGVLLALAS